MRPAPAPAVALLLLIGSAAAQVRYFGKELGALSALQHAVRGTVYAVDSRTIYIHDFHYDGEGPAAYFYVGTSGTPRRGAGAARLRDERGGSGPLRKYNGESITLTLPDGKSLRDYRWFSVYCDEYEVNFGDVVIPRGVEYPRPAKVAALRGVHAVSSDPIVIVDAQTILVPNFSYDGEAPDAKFWVGRGDKPSPQGIRIPDENGKEAPLRRYDKKTIVLTLPGELTVFDIGHFAVWCEAFTVNFGHVVLPHAALANVPPSLKMLGVSPQSKLNCEVLYDDLAFEVRWAVAGDSIVMQLVAKLEDGEYMAFGISGDPVHSQMVGGDVAVAWVDKNTLKGYADDYYLDAKSQCAGVRGSCPDERLVENTNSIRLLNAALVNGYSIVTYQRSLRAADVLDLPVLTNASQPIIWAIGPLNSRDEVSYHSHFTKGDKLLEFGRPPIWNCPMPEGEEQDHALDSRREQAQQGSSHEGTHPNHEHGDHHNHSIVPKQSERTHVIKPNPVPTPAPVPKVTPWEIPAIQCYEPPDGVFYAQMGPTGGKQGYSAITGHVGWGISWYINGLLIPEINVVRGRKYTFVVEGGSDPNVPARYHPFYITDDPVGGYFHKTSEEKKGIRIFAGVRQTRSGGLTPTGVGRLCNWTPEPSGPQADEYPSFGAYQRALTLVCEEGNPGVVTWIPDKSTPDTVYYQCFTHRHLGWKINVLDECDASDSAESRIVESIAIPDDMQTQDSVQVQTRLTPDENFLNERKKIEKIINMNANYNNFSSLKGVEGLTGEVYPESEAFGGQEFELPISNGQMKNLIQTVENIESNLKDAMKKNVSQYQVHEDVKETFGFEQPVREDDEYFIDPAKLQENFLLPPNQKPLTLQTVLRPNMPIGNVRPPYRRPAPPEIKLRRPPLPPSKVPKGNGYPLPMPNYNSVHGPLKKPQTSSKPNVIRPPLHMNRPTPMDRPMIPPRRDLPIPPMKTMAMPMQTTFYYQQIKQNSYPVTKLLPKTQNAFNNPMQSIVMGTPSLTQPTLPYQGQTLNLGQSDIIANQVVKSQIMLPGSNDAIAQQTNVQTYLNAPGQIILGKPMDNPVPLDQQMIPTKQYGTQTSSTPIAIFLKSTPRVSIKQDNKQQSQNEIKLSDFLGQSTDTTSMVKPAVNTGFKPDSIVVESGFKPIIREPLMAAEDRIADTSHPAVQPGNSNRREDTDIVEEYEDSPQHISNSPIFPTDSLAFEPMFIPSPEDHLLSVQDKTKDNFPKNHAKEDRPHPVYVKSESELNNLFGGNNIKNTMFTDLVMASDRLSPHYLPPDLKTTKEISQKITVAQTFTTYDGKTVSADSLTSVAEGKPPKLFSAKFPSTEQLLKSPQFGPFKGETPPPVAEHISEDSKTNNTQTTILKLVNIKNRCLTLTQTTSMKEPNPTRNCTENIMEQKGEITVNRTKRETTLSKSVDSDTTEVQTNGHSKPITQVEFESTPQVSAATNMRLYWMLHLIIFLTNRLNLI